MFDAYKNRSVLITGGAGFIGSHLAQELVNHGARTTIFDNLSTGSLEHIESIKHAISFIQGDIRDYAAVMRAVQGQEIIFHCAAYTSVSGSIEYPSECFDHNVTGTLNILWAAHAHAIKKCVFSSSASVYGDYHGVCHEHIEPKPLSPYADSKRLGELMCQHFFNAHGLDTLILRYFNVVGQRASTKTFPAYAAQQLAEDKPIIIYGDGTQTRDFVPVHTVVQANMLGGLMPKSAAAIINVASGESLSINHMLHQLQEKFPTYRGCVEYKPWRTGDIKHSQADISRLKKLYATIDATT